jgi:hypothetical protein
VVNVGVLRTRRRHCEYLCGMYEDCNSVCTSTEFAVGKELGSIIQLRSVIKGFLKFSIFRKRTAIYTVLQK